MVAGLGSPSSSARSSRVSLAKAAGQDTLLAVESLFPGLKTNTPDFKTKWEPAVPRLRELLTNKTILGFNLGDELVRSAHMISDPTQYNVRTVSSSACD